MLILTSITLCLLARVACARDCRNVPGSPGFPTDAQWQALNVSVSGRLVRAVPSGEYCRQISCTDAEWTSAIWRNTVPGAMNEVNWEQDYDANPPSLCGHTSPATCGQGNVPLYAILAENAKDIQAGVKFASKHNIRLSVKASGHDLLGRSTAKHSLLIHTQKLQSVAFTEDFFVRGRNKGSAVTVGSGVGMNTLYNVTQRVGKIVVGGGLAATVVAAGGYVQGAGHSPLSPLLGLGADNVLEFSIVTADGILRRANELENSDLFWALRGGGAGSWGVIVNATFRTFPTFDAVLSTIAFSASNSTILGSIAQVHAEHVFEWDSFNASQVLIAVLSGSGSAFDVTFTFHFPRATISQVDTALAPFIHDVVLRGGLLRSNTSITSNINALLEQPDDQTGGYGVGGSRLIPAKTFKTSPRKIGDAYRQLADVGTALFAVVFVAGGKVAENADIDNAVNPAWRTAKAHFIVSNMFSEQSTIDEVHEAQNRFQTTQAPLLKSIEGPVPAAYSNEADAFEKDWQSVFYGRNYPRLRTIKKKYDPTDLFIVRTGVGSERWDEYGLCRI